MALCRCQNGRAQLTAVRPMAVIQIRDVRAIGESRPFDFRYLVGLTRKDADHGMLLDRAFSEGRRDADPIARPKDRAHRVTFHAFETARTSGHRAAA